MVTGGVSKFAKAHTSRDSRYLVKEALDYALSDVGMDVSDIDGSVGAYFSEHFQRQLLGTAMVHDYLGLNPKPHKRVEGGGATGGLAFQAAYEEVASGRMDVCLVFGFENMSHVSTWKGNEFIAMASDMNFDYPVGGFYTAYYAMMAVRHMHQFGTTVEQMAKVSVKNHGNARYNRYAQSPMEITVEDVRRAPMISYPFTRLDVCTMSDGAAVAILASEDRAFQYTDRPTRIEAIGSGSDTMRLSDRPRGKVPLLPHEEAEWYRDLDYPGLHNFRAARVAAIEAYKKAGIEDPAEQVDFMEVHDAYTSLELQLYEDLGLARIGHGGELLDSGFTEMGGKVPVNPSGGLLGCGHAIGATGIMLSVFTHWQLQHSVEKHLGSGRLQVPNAKRGLVLDLAGTGTLITVTVMGASR
ncbi:acetyl-CoA acetyltransferase [Thermogymnomonas acidicola]|uniref:Acetyl-CoA acetyltransferase n=2 Tax=Thermogymnomonas acidicola TaxID=399579 RepID=A0AA37FA27_9ARCH|nr:acetyl-CoA acetyltransferase [Thermogymnomonas acidicola]